MTDFEKWSLIFNGCMAFSMIVGIFYGLLQLKKLVESNRILQKTAKDSHDWNRRDAAQTALKDLRSSVLLSNLNKHFDYLNLDREIDLKRIEAAFGLEEELQNELHGLLNYYEGLARGVHQGIYDEEVVRKARGRNMSNLFRCFRPYILNRRVVASSPNAWCEMEAIAMKWDSDRAAVAYRAKADA